MKKLLIGIIIVLMTLSPIYAASGFVITFGEATIPIKHGKIRYQIIFNHILIKMLVTPPLKL